VSDLEHVLHNWTTTSQPIQATKRRPGDPPALCVVPVTQTDDEPIAESSRGPARCAATAGNPEVDLTDKVPSRAADHPAGPQVTQRSATLGHLTSEEGEAPLFENSNEELEYLQRKHAHLEKQREIECLRTQVLGKNTHQHGDSLDAFAEHLATQRPAFTNLPLRRAPVEPPSTAATSRKT
jgi:hypothetical protein